MTLTSRFSSCAVLALAVHAAAFAQTFPSKPVRMLVPFSAGSGTDILARTVAQKMTENWGQQVLVENRPGAGGTVAANAVLGAPADGYTMMLVSAGHAANATLYRKLPYDTMKDFAGVSIVASTPNVLVVGPGLGVKTVKDLIALVKSKPGQFNYSSAGIGSGTHLNGEQFKLEAGLDAQHVAYRGAPEALSDAVAGRVQFAFSPIVVALPFVKDGRGIALAVSTAARTPVLPDVPTMAEAALPGFDFDQWYGLLVSAKTPKPLREQISKEVARIMQLPDVKERLAAQGGIPRYSTPEEFDAFIRVEVDKLGRVVKAANAYAD